MEFVTISLYNCFLGALLNGVCNRFCSQLVVLLLEQFHLLAFLSCKGGILC
jgi:hypothetical protein